MIPCVEIPFSDWWLRFKAFEWYMNKHYPDCWVVHYIGHV